MCHQVSFDRRVFFLFKNLQRFFCLILHVLTSGLENGSMNQLSLVEAELLKERERNRERGGGGGGREDGGDAKLT
jgi:hypothetical protein